MENYVWQAFDEAQDASKKHDGRKVAIRVKITSIGRIALWVLKNIGVSAKSRIAKSVIRRTVSLSRDVTTC